MRNVLKQAKLPWQIILGVITLFAAIIAVVLIANPPPPKTVTIATSATGGTYGVYGEKYKAFFAKRGIDLILLPTKGGQENADLLLDSNSEVDIAFIQGGLIDPAQADNLQTLGSIGYEPIWVFYRGADKNGNLQKFTDFSGRKFAIGAKGSGTYTEAMHMLQLNGLDKSPNLVEMPTNEAVDAIERGDIDAIFLIQGLKSGNVQRLLNNPDLHLANFVRAEAYAQNIPYLERLTVPMGGLDIKRNFPDERTQLIATTTELVTKKRLHPAIQMLFMQAAQEINGKEDFFTKRGEFPAFHGSGLHESEQAALYYQKGLPFLMNHLPFWLAEFIHRTIFFLLPILIIAFPVIKYLPEFWENRMRDRINNVYARLEKLEQEIGGNVDPVQQPAYLARLDDIEELAFKLKHSKTHSLEYYTLRSHIDYVRSCLQAGKPYQRGQR
jgi:TRAP transporter TAXI family solute receptor